MSAALYCIGGFDECMSNSKKAISNNYVRLVNLRQSVYCQGPKLYSATADAANLTKIYAGHFAKVKAYFFIGRAII